MLLHFNTRLLIASRSTSVNHRLFLIVLPLSLNLCSMDGSIIFYPTFIIRNLLVSANLSTVFLYRVAQIGKLHGYSIDMYATCTLCVMVSLCLSTDRSRSKTSKPAQYNNVLIDVFSFIKTINHNVVFFLILTHIRS